MEPIAIPDGWKILKEGRAASSDKRWTARLNAFIPVTKGDGFWGVKVELVPTIIIRKERD